MSSVCCAAGAQAYPGPCPWHDSQLMRPYAPVVKGDVQEERLRLDDHPSQGGSRKRVSKSNKSLSGLDSRVDPELSSGLKALIAFALFTGFCVFGGIMWVLISFGVFLIQLNP